MEGVNNNQEKGTNFYAKELEDFGEHNGNKIKIIEKGDIKGILKNIEMESEDVLKMTKGFLEKYLSGPIFTDGFSSNYWERKDWARDNKIKMSPELLEYYNWNRVKRNNFDGVTGFLKVLTSDEEILKNVEIKKKLLELIKKIPPKMTEKTKEGFEVYNFLSDEEKVEAVQEFSEITKEALAILEKISK